MIQAFLGQIVHTKSLNDFVVLPNGFIAIEDGKIIGIGDNYDSWKVAFNKSIEEITLKSYQFLMPGLVDCHIHAGQMPNIGLGLNKPLLEWLNTYTLPLEAKYKDTEFARSVYSEVIKLTINRGTTLASYFATNCRESSIILAEEAIKQGQRAFIGKTCSDCSSPDYYIETTTESLEETLNFVESVLNLKSDLVKPIVTPRFALSCSEDLMKGLANIASRYDLNIQSHISENLTEIELIKEKFGKSYAKVYEDTGILTNKCIMAHGVHLDDDEVEIFRRTGAAIAHCPASNTMLFSGLCDVKRLLNKGVKVGLGTDVSGGNSASIQDAILRTMDVSHHIEFIKNHKINTICSIEDSSNNDSYIPLNYKEVLYLATLGGAEALSVADKTGNFEIGKDFDALLIDLNTSPFNKFTLPMDDNKSSQDKLLEYVQRFIYVGDDRNIIQVYVKGRQIKTQM